MASYEPSPRPLSDLVHDLWSDTSALLQQESRLAQAEMAERLDGTTQDVIVLVAGAVLLFVALIAGAAAAVLGLIALGLSPWISALGVTAVFGGIGLAMVTMPISRLRSRSLVPHRTLASIKETAQWLKGGVTG
ncbi:MAG: phage holin family protein [Vicinamibacterales bacterium]